MRPPKDNKVAESLAEQAEIYLKRLSTPNWQPNVEDVTALRNSLRSAVIEIARLQDEAKGLRGERDAAKLEAKTKSDLAEELDMQLQAYELSWEWGR